MYKVFVAFLIVVLIASCNGNKHKKAPQQHIPKDTVAVQTVCVDTICSFFLGINVDSFYIESKTIQRKDVLEKIFKNLQFTKKDYKLLNKQILKQQQFQGIKPKQQYYILSKLIDSNYVIQYLAFELNQKDYMIIHCADSFKISFYEKKIDTIRQALAFIVQSKIKNSLKDKNINQQLIEKINHVFNPKISTHQLKTGDTLRVIYDDLYIDGNFYALGDIHCASIHTKKKSYFITEYFLPEDSAQIYADEQGKYHKISFLSSPLKKGFIVSRYNLQRFHPILLEVRPHLGTDFAAPHGTPILATASGIVEAATFSENNGNYVKIKHNKTYTTQYLHMSKFAKNMRVGQHVRQGEIIGYVGSTGLSTGSHVCYRFWKNGAQVDPFKEKLSTTTVIDKAHKVMFDSLATQQKLKLNSIGF